MRVTSVSRLLAGLLDAGRNGLLRVLTLLLAAANGLAAMPTPDFTIEWERSSAQAVCPGGYARARLLRNGELMLVYSHHATALARRSRDRGATWETPAIVSQHEGWSDTNSELIELDNGWLIYGLNSRPLRQNEGRLPYAIRTLLSRDGGRTWQDERDAFVGGKVFRDGCWEPAFLQLPSGELQLYFANEAPYTASREQEISLVRSFDRGLTWSHPITVAFRSGHRDGMPVPLLLPSGTIVCAIEDNGFNGDFKPVLIRTSLASNWSDGPVLADSERRIGALGQTAALAANIYAGAPYLAMLPSGETLLVVQSAQGRLDRKHALPVVYVSKRDALDFCQPTSPFRWLPDDAAAEWNSLTVLDASTVMLITTVRGHQTGPGRSPEIWTLRGKVVRTPRDTTEVTTAKESRPTPPTATPTGQAAR